MAASPRGAYRGPSHAAILASQISGRRRNRPRTGYQRRRVPRRPLGAPGASPRSRPGPLLRRGAGSRTPRRCRPSSRTHSGRP
nr:hypothetical protein [Tanacetum cinerariifolium]